MEEKLLYKVSDLIKLYSFSRRQIDRFCESKKLTPQYINGVRYFTKDEIEKFLKENLKSEPTDKVKERTQKAIQNSQIKSKERVSKKGEVFTNPREVKAMCDLVDNELNTPDKIINARYLEPACGSGNFLIEILTRKLNFVKKKYKSQYDFEKYALLTIGSVYGIEIMNDNCKECKERLLDLFINGRKKGEYNDSFKGYKKLFKDTWNQHIIDSVEYILDSNIVWANGLTMKMMETNDKDSDIDIIFPEWTLVNGIFNRNDFQFSYNSKTKKYEDTRIITYSKSSDFNLKEMEIVKDWREN